MTVQDIKEEEGGPGRDGYIHHGGINWLEDTQTQRNEGK